MSDDFDKNDDMPWLDDDDDETPSEDASSDEDFSFDWDDVDDDDQAEEPAGPGLHGGAIVAGRRHRR